MTIPHQGIGRGRLVPSSGDCYWLLVCSGVLVCSGISTNRSQGRFGFNKGKGALYGQLKRGKAGL